METHALNIFITNILEGLLHMRAGGNGSTLGAGDGGGGGPGGNGGGNGAGERGGTASSTSMPSPPRCSPLQHSLHRI